ncbi:peptide chain release factor 1 [Helicoverpa armigera]|uniref:peptide chain release factor 1 n=1 Tax=Helicoverpa armigera TaxID=29058 RepID=UPI003082D358
MLPLRISLGRQILKVKSFVSLRRYYSPQNDFNLSDVAVQAYFKKLLFEHEELYTKMKRTPEESKRFFEIKPIVNVLQHRITLYENIESLQDLVSKQKSKDDEDMKKMIKEEAQIYMKRMTDVDRELQSILLEPQLTEGAVLVELKAGEGGHEAMLFARDLYEMYERYAKYKDWDIRMVSVEKSDIGGILKALMFIEGVGAPELMRIEAGAHRVQRIPTTERGGLIHTSTVLVSVFSKPSNMVADISKRDLAIEYKSSDKTAARNGVRVVHTPTGIVVECSEKRSKTKNKDIAIEALKTLLLNKEQQELKIEGRPKMDAVEINDTIRTYNFPQDQVTEHREGGGTIHRLQAFMEGDYKLEQMQQNLLREYKRQAFLEEISKFSEKPSCDK